MSRYFSRQARAYKPLICEDTWYRDPLLVTPTVCDHDATPTGLLDHNGDEIMRAPRPIGFGRDGEW